MCINRSNWPMSCIFFWFFKYMYPHRLRKFYSSLRLAHLRYNYSPDRSVPTIFKTCKPWFQYVFVWCFYKKKFHFRKTVIFLHFFICVFSVKSRYEWFMNMGFPLTLLKTVIAPPVEMETNVEVFGCEWQRMRINVYLHYN